VRNWSSVSSAEFTAKSTATHYISGLLRCVLAVGLKWLGNAALGVRHGVHQLEQWQIAQLGTAVKLTLRMNVTFLTWHSMDDGIEILS
jgi:hypothetical protein